MAESTHDAVDAEVEARLCAAAIAHFEDRMLELLGWRPLVSGRRELWRDPLTHDIVGRALALTYARSALADERATDSVGPVVLRGRAVLSHVAVSVVGAARERPEGCASLRLCGIAADEAEAVMRATVGRAGVRALVVLHPGTTVAAPLGPWEVSR